MNRFLKGEIVQSLLVSLTWTFNPSGHCTHSLHVFEFKVWMQVAILIKEQMMSKFPACSINQIQYIKLWIYLRLRSLGFLKCLEQKLNSTVAQNFYFVCTCNNTKAFSWKNAQVISLGLRFAGEQAFRGSDPLICKVMRQRSRLCLQLGGIWIRSGVCLSAAAQILI